jgi:hypothetical protein
MFSLLAGAAASGADLYIKQTRHTDAYTVMGQSQPEKNETVVIWLGEARSRTDMGEETSILVFPEKKMLVLLNHDNLTYVEMPMNAGGMLAAAAGEEESEEAKRAMEMARGLARGVMQSIEAKVTETGETKSIKNWACRKYLIEISMPMGKSVSEAWATEDIPFDPRLYWTAANAMMAAQQGFEKMFEELKKVKGMIVYQESKSEAMGAEVKTVERIVEISKKTAPAGTFEVPSEYKKLKTPLLSFADEG